MIQEPSLLTFKFRHNKDVTGELAKAWRVAEFAVANPKCRTSRAVSEIGLDSNISNQILRKYGNQKPLKSVHRVNLIVPGRCIKYCEETQTIWIPNGLKIQLECLIPYTFEKICQAEVDREFLYLTVQIESRPEMIPQQFLGVDRNTTGHIAVAANPDSGQVLKLGKSALYIHSKYKHIRKRLQKNKKFRQVKRLKDRESRIVRDLNHKISRKLVDVAKTQHAALVFEDLTGIRSMKKQRRSFKYALHSWSFYQLQQFVEYKAKLLGVPVLYVNPAFTSQTYSREIQRVSVPLEAREQIERSVQIFVLDENTRVPVDGSTALITREFEEVEIWRGCVYDDGLPTVVMLPTDTRLRFNATKRGYIPVSLRKTFESRPKKPTEALEILMRREPTSTIIVNYSEPDPRLRITIPVSVAYGSNPAKVKQILREIAHDTFKNTAFLLDDPIPTVFFLEFGDSSLKFVLSVWARKYNLPDEIRDAINTRIADRFASEGIEIPFPRMDVRLRKI
jgi:putative transposase